MPFNVHSYRRFPVDCPVTYERLYDEGHRTAWNISSTGFRVSGTLPLQPGDICSLILTLQKQVAVLAGVVRWVQGQDFGIETLLMDKKGEARLRRYIQELAECHDILRINTS